MQRKIHNALAKHRAKPCACYAKIAPGNSKLGKHIRNISFRPVIDCPKGVPCAKMRRTKSGKLRPICYAWKAWLQYKEVRKAWTLNAKAAAENRELHFADIRHNLTSNPTEFFRWFVAGDFPDQDYVNRVKSIAREFPNTSFLAFTKRHDLAFINLPSNLTIIASFWPGWGDEKAIRRKGLPIAWMQDATETRIPKTAIKCPGTCEGCGMCWELPKLGRDVYFPQH